MQESISESARAGDPSLEMQVIGMRLEAPDVLSIELQSSEGEPLPPARAGAHLDVFLQDGVIRPYSVVASDTKHYLLAVKRESKSRGGSQYVHDRLRVGDRVRVGAPRHQFGLADDAKPSVLIAGGIGITPLLPMARELERMGRPWRLHYSTRDASTTPFARQLDAFGDKVRWHSSQASGRLDLKGLIDQAEPGSHFYCCGPSSMLDAFAAATRDLDPDQVHMERFEAIAPPADAGSFEILLAKSKISVVVAPEVSALDAVLQAGVHVDHSCRQGICGSCEVRVLDGVPEHHDEILTQAERAGNKTIMLCCSRACTPRLVLDL